MIKEREELILNLKRIEGNEYRLNEGEKAMDFAQHMLEYIGDIDPKLRDDLIYSTFCNWIYEKDYFNNEELIKILDTIVDEKHLFFHIGNQYDNTVFTRTFSVLIVDLLLGKERQKPFLDTEKFIKVKDSLIKYYNEENDLRGYLDNMGWAHGAAHGADAMLELAISKKSDEVVLSDILKALERVLYNGKYFLSNEEDERMTRVVFIILMKDLLPKESLTYWIEGLSKCIESEYSREQYITRVNTKNFIRCLYFSLMHQKNTEDITGVLFKVEERLNKFIKTDKQVLKELESL